MSTTTDRLAEHVAAIPLLDHHCHAPLRLPQAIDGPALRAPFTESTNQDVRVGDVPQTFAYRAMIHWLSGLLGCDPTEDAVLRARAGYTPEAYQRLLADDAVLSTLYADYLFAEGHSYTPHEWSSLTGRPVRPVLRIESFAERLLPSAASWDSFRHEFTESLAASHSRGVVAFKSIAAYRSGLEIQRVDASEAAAAFDEVRAEIEEAGPVRLTNKPLIDALIWQTLEVASELGVPFQFHVGLGDDDVYLPTSNPTLMRAVFQEPRYSGVPIVLLHNYPYVREAAYLASIYPNAYVDLGLTIPLAGPDSPALLRQALGLAPVSKVLASSDGHGVPEFQWLAARMWRRALVRVLADVVDEGMLGDAEATEVAAMVLHATAELIYPA
ncbi:MAG TPA: amidohydrolase family protein [Thermomicrobiaceae bacterium]|nr:amidohydrolase family protein [Thermomicrobiaceae bacterium]